VKLTMLLAASIALYTDDCGPDAPALSLNGLVPDSIASCESALVGGWGGGMNDSGGVWVIVPEEPGCAKGGLNLVITDTAVAQILLDSVRMALLHPDSTGKDLLKDKRLRKRQKQDFALVNREPWLTFTFKTFRDSAGLYADFIANSSDGCPNSCIETHWIERADVSGDSLRFLPFADNWLTKALDSGWIATPAARQGDRYVLTGQTSDLQELLRMAEAYPDAFQASDDQTFARWTPKTQKR
jgi:hypothetical protein